MINKYLKEYVESQNNKQQNFNAILSKVEGGSKMNFFKKNLFKIAVPVLAVMLIIISVPKINAYFEFQAEFKEFQRMPIVYGNGIKIDEESVEMNYIERNGIKSKIDSVVATDDEIRVIISFDIPEKYEVNSETFRFSYAIYDNEKNLYAVYNRRNGLKKNNLPEIISKDLGIAFDKHNMYGNILSDSNEGGVISVTGRTITSEIIINSTKGFPKSKSIKIKVFDLGYFVPNKEMNRIDDYDISSSSWEFEIEIPDKFYYSNSINLELLNNIEDFELLSAKISDTNLTMILENNYILKILNDGVTIHSEEWMKILDKLIYVTDEAGNKYETEELATAGENKISFRSRVTKDKLDNTKLFLNITIDGKIYTSELVRMN